MQSQRNNTVVASVWVSLDGFASDAPDEQMSWVTDDFGPELGEWGVQQMRAMDTLLLGRVTYDIMAAYWPDAGEEEGEFTALMNDTPKVVISQSLRPEQIAWQNTRVAPGALAEEVSALEGTVGVTGSIDLTRSLIGGCLLDRLHLLVHPVVLGGMGGKRMFGGYEQTGMRLVDTAVLDGRVARLTYEP